jgi:hypothetical protein
MLSGRSWIHNMWDHLPPIECIGCANVVHNVNAGEKIRSADFEISAIF